VGSPAFSRRGKNALFKLQQLESAFGFGIGEFYKKIPPLSVD